MAKRKREASSSVDSHESPSTSGDEDGSPQIIIAENPFQVKMLPLNNTTKLPKAHKNWTAGAIQEPASAGAAEIAYKIYPADRWERMRKYSRFVVLGKTFGVGDYVFIYHGQNRQGSGLGAGIDPNNWVAQVLEIRAEDTTHVYIRVFWMYWPDELPEGRDYYHGGREVIASNHMEIMDAMTVTDTADVLRLEEQSATPTAELYWRLKLDFMTGKIIGLKRDCYCGEYYNPEERLIQCPHCETFLHERCLLRDACSRAWFREKSKNSSPDQQLLQEASSVPHRNGTIPDSQQSNGTSASSQPQSLPPPPPPYKSSTGSRGKKQKIKSSSKIDPWAAQMKAHAEMRLVDGEDMTEATGMATVTYDPINQVAQDISIGLRCLMPRCGRWLYDEPASHQDDNHNHIKIETSPTSRGSVQVKDEDESDKWPTRSPSVHASVKANGIAV